MKILMLCDNYPPEMNANARIFSELAELWSLEGHDISVITSHPNFPGGKIFPGYKNCLRKKYQVNQVDVIRVKTYIHPNIGLFRRTLDFLSFGFSSFICGLFERGNHLVIGVTPQFFAAVSGCFLALLKRKPFVLVLCDLWPDSIVSNKVISAGFSYKLVKKLEVFMYRKASTIAILSPYFRKYLNELQIDNKKIVNFISGPSAVFYPREKNKSLLKKYNLSPHLTIGYIGTLGISHNLEEVLHVFKNLKESLIHLLMIGDGAKAVSLRTLKEQHHLCNVTLDGPFALNEIPEYWSLCDVALIPLSPTETNKTVIPSKVLEAMSMGIPVILYTPTGEASHFFARSQATWHVESGDVMGLQRLLNHIAKNTTEIKEKQKNALAFAKEFSREKQAQILIQHLSYARNVRKE